MYILTYLSLCSGGGTEIRLGSVCGMGGGAGMRGCEAADYSCEASACKGQELGGGGGAKTLFVQACA